MDAPRIEKEIFPDLMTPPFHYACFTRFVGYSEDRHYTVHSGFQFMLGLEGTLHFELEADQRRLAHRAGSVFVLSPGLRHRWQAEPGGFCENFMFFCDGFSATDGDLGRLFPPGGPELVWLFDLAPELIAFYVGQFRALVRQREYGNAAIMHGLLYSFCGQICRQAGRLGLFAAGSEQHPALSRALEIIHRDYRVRISLEQLSRQCGIGSSRLSELFRRSLGMAPLQYVTNLKIRKAGQLLACSDMNITEISDYLGFSSVHYFSRLFKQHTGRTPSEVAAARS